jgi:hypothetical protein
MLCNSTIVYGVIGIVGLFVSRQYVGILFILPYLFLIEWVCSKNWMASWLLIFLPPVVMVFYVLAFVKH